MSSPTPSSPLQARAAFFLSRALPQFAQGTVQGIQAVMAGLRQLIDTIGMPVYRIRPIHAKELLYSDDYLAMVGELGQDVQTLATTLPQLAQQGLNTANTGQALIVGLQEQLQSVQGQADSLLAQAQRSAVGHTLGLGELSPLARQRAETIRETYATGSAIDDSQSHGIYYDPAACQVTLQRNSDISYQGSVTPFVTFFDSQGMYGLPGNTVEVETPQVTVTNTTGDTSTPAVTFTGAASPNADITAILDSDPTTVYEFERCDLCAEREPITQLGDAWFYADSGTVQDIYQVIKPDDWTVTVNVTQADGSLKTLHVNKLGPPQDRHDGLGLCMNLSLTFDTPTPLNYIELDPYLPPQANQTLPILVQSIVVTPLTGSPIVLNTSHAGTLTGSTVGVPDGYIVQDSIFTLPATVVATQVQIVLRQPTAYTTYLGHNYIVATVQTETKKSILGFTYSDKVQVTKPRLENQSEVLNYAENKSNAGLATAGAALGFLAGGPIGATIGWVIASLFGRSVTQQVLNTATGVDVFKGARWQIGLRTVDLKQISYETTGTLVSTPYTFSQPVTAVRIDPVLSADPSTGTLLTFDVSGDGGQTWLPTDPTGQTLTPLATASTTIQVRATFQRRDATPVDQGLTPILAGFNLQGYYQ